MYACVRLDEFDEDLSSDVPQKIFYVFSDEGILHYIPVVGSQDLLKLVDVIVLVCTVTILVSLECLQ